jgi:hypothetical protein
MGQNPNGPIGQTATTRRPHVPSASESLGYTDGARSLVLSTSDVEMLDAILVDKSPEAVLTAMVEQGG